MRGVAAVHPVHLQPGHAAHGRQHHRRRAARDRPGHHRRRAENPREREAAGRPRRRARRPAGTPAGHRARPRAGQEPGRGARATWFTLISPRGMLAPTGHVPAMKPFRVSGYFESGMYEFDQTFAYIHLARRPAAAAHGGCGDRDRGPRRRHLPGARGGRRDRGAAGPRLLRPGLDADEPQPVQGPQAGAARDVHHPDADRAGGGVQHRQLADHDGDGQDQGHRHPQGHGGHRPQHPQDLRASTAW
ncbi:MAG: hypothetical protein MZV70_07385 [Desulfobacterales bacterium]|nr:hypothetical protein [Desulfobacterales bacterium]